MTHHHDLHFDSPEHHVDVVIGELERGERDPTVTLSQQLERLEHDLLDWVAWTIISELCVEEPDLGDYVAPYRARIREDMPERVLYAAKRYTRARVFIDDAGIAWATHPGLELGFRDGSRAVFDGRSWHVRLGVRGDEASGQVPVVV